LRLISLPQDEDLVVAQRATEQRPMNRACTPEAARKLTPPVIHHPLRVARRLHFQAGLQSVNQTRL
jgi:hypothetical protein